MTTPIIDALAIANKVLDRPHADPDDDLATMARGVVLMHEYATRPTIEAREIIARWMMARGYATGHGDTIEDLMAELEGEANDHGARGVPPRRSVG